MTRPEIKGFVEASFCDWDGCVSCVIFLPGCNLRCPFCQNGDLILDADRLPTIDLSRVREYLEANREWIDGVVITGGEPTIHRGLADLLGEFKGMGFGVKLDTNGTSPGQVERLIRADLVDFIAMDIKAPLDQRYEKACGVKVDVEAIRRSVQLVMGFGDAYEFRTTLVPGVVGEEEIGAIARAVEGARRLALQRFVPDNSLDISLRQAIPFEDEFVSRLVEIAAEHVETCFYRGKLGVGLS